MERKASVLERQCAVLSFLTELAASSPDAKLGPARVRRAASLQKTRDAKLPAARMNAATLSRLKLEDGAAVSVRQGGGEAMLTVALDAGVPEGCVRIAAAHPATRTLGPMFGHVAVEGV